MSSKLLRREFLGAVGAAAAAMPVLGTVRRRRHLESLRTAHIGVGGMGASDLASIASHGKVDVAALCDVDSERLAVASKAHPAATVHVDYREMLSALAGKVDAVVVSTPDHTHAVAAMTAMNMGLPVYCQKPLTHEVIEARRLREVAEQKGLVTQMGIQIHSHAAYRKTVVAIQEGVIGKVSEVHAWSSKNWGYDGAAFSDFHDVPKTLNWDLWLGTAAARPYVQGAYHPGNWRKLIDFGTGTLGDMGVHIFDTPYAALKLTAPVSVVTECRPPGGPGHPEQNVVRYDFPGTEFTAERLKWVWYDGAQAPPALELIPQPSEFAWPDGYALPGQGSLFVGETGILVLPHIAEPLLFPEAAFRETPLPDVSGADHYHEWVDACLNGDKTSADFSYSGPLTEALLLGVVANRFPGETLRWNAMEMHFMDHAQATGLLNTTPRPEFTVSNLHD